LISSGAVGRGCWITLEKGDLINIQRGDLFAVLLKSLKLKINKNINCLSSSLLIILYPFMAPLDHLILVRQSIRLSKVLLLRMTYSCYQIAVLVGVS
jgi:hypothetical protein